MRRLLLRAWPLMAVVALATTLTLQIPRKALFFKPVERVSSRPFASFVSYDAAAYASVVQKARMSWQVRGARGRTFESHVDAFDLAEDLPPPKALRLPEEFLNARAPGAADGVPVPLLPPSVADVSALVPVDAPPEEGGDVRGSRADLLALPESLQSTD